jgi:hypothetical protein
MFDRQSIEIDIGKTADINGHHSFAIRSCSTTEGADAAIFAEHVRDFLLIEAVFAKRILTLQQLELIDFGERQKIAFPRAYRAIAAHDCADVGGDFVDNSFAVTGSLIALGGHWFLLLLQEY